MLLSVEKPVLKCCIPRRYKEDEDFEAAIEMYENELIDETMKPLIYSGHAFICFDSVASVNQILKHFKIVPGQRMTIFIQGVKQKIKDFFMWITGQDT